MDAKKKKAAVVRRKKQGPRKPVRGTVVIRAGARWSQIRAHLQRIDPVRLVIVVLLLPGGAGMRRHRFTRAEFARRFARELNDRKTYRLFKPNLS